MKATKGPNGQEMATAACADCGTIAEVSAAHTHHGAMARGGKITLRLMNEGQALKKLEKSGWSLVSGKIRCPACEAARRRAKADPAPASVKGDVIMTIETDHPDLRQPTARMTAQIVGLLEDAYDDKAKRYRNPQDTDKTIAEVIGGGCLWGWVAAIREKEFGPDTRNAEVDAISAELRKLDGRVGAAVGEIRQVETAVNALRSRLDKLA